MARCGPALAARRALRQGIGPARMEGLTAQWLQRLGAEIAWAYAARLALALAAVMALGWGTGRA